MMKKAASIFHRFNSIICRLLSLHILLQPAAETILARELDGPSFPHNLSIGKGRFIYLSQLIYLAAVLSGCTLPPYTTSLDEILEEQDLSDRLWGHSGLRTFFLFLRYKLVSIFH